MRVLVACEESQIVTKAFRDAGHEAFSCDIKEPSGGHPEWHMVDDATKLLNDGWDMLIGFPPCTHLCSSGARWWAQKRQDGRQQEAINLFLSLATSNISKIAIENPIGIMSTAFRKPDQIVQPWWFGDRATKSTCLWLKNLPKLKPTNVVDEGEFFIWKDKNTGIEKRYPKWLLDAKTKSDYSTIRSKTFNGIARAMANQWGGE